MRSRAVNLILIGYGNVGRAFFQLQLKKRALVRRRHGLDIGVFAIVEVDGVVASNKFLDETCLPPGPAAELRRNPLWKTNVPLDALFRAKEPGVLVECTPSSLRTGEPGLSHIRTALDSGWHVVTANKGPLVVDFTGLRQKAKENRVALKFGGATAAALPTLDVGLYSLAGAEVESIEGILNGTTNYILTRMAEGMSYRDALRDAQAKGIAEHDPSLDVDGWDTAAKLLLIANAVMGSSFALQDVRVEGIAGLTPETVQNTAKEEETLKLLGRASQKRGQFRAEVTPVALGPGHPLFGVNGTNKGITFFTDTMGTVTVTGGKSDPRGAAAALFKDIINIFRPA
jgi:homoserine dehydrogenase